ncbi:uncharacterized protein LOC134826205 isoform X2 [Bolinopsis microptera]|uniref:uncharacterized protein LOC134826205 isoform X2 n=1 Tax=Bolinopsis microptera TaxID=2820187 RepID=UPI003078AE1C
MTIFDRLRHSPNKLEKSDKAASNSSLGSDPLERVKQMDASMQGSVYSDSGISCTSSSRHPKPPRGEDELKHINRMYDAYETGSVRSHNTSRSNSTYRSAGDISASVSTFKPFLFTASKDISNIGSEDSTPFEKFVEVLITTMAPQNKGKQPVSPGYQDDTHLWAIFSSSRLNLKIPPDQVRTMRDWFYASEHESKDLTVEFINSVRDLITHLSRERPLYGPSWIAIMDHNSRELFFNRVTGEARYGVPKDFPTLSEMDVFGRTIHEMFYSVTTKGINHITIPQFDDICNSKKYNFDLKQEEKSKLMRSIVKTLNEEEVIFYEDFVPVGRALLLKWYRQQYPKGGDWLKLSSKRYGFFYLNKMTGETTFRPAQYEREQLSLYLQDTLKEVETLKETIKFQEEETSSATKQLNNVTKECEEQGEEVSSLKSKIIELEDELKSEKNGYEQLLEKYDSTAKALEESRSEVDTWMSANSVLQALKTKVEEALEEKVKEILAYEHMVEELNGDVEVLKDDIAKANAFANAKDSELAGLLFDYEEEKKAHGETGEKFKDAEEALSSQIRELEMKLSVGSESNKSLSSTTEQLQLSIEQILVIKKNLEGKVKEIEKDIAEEKEKNKELTEANQTHEKRNAMMDSDLKTFKEQHLTAKNKEMNEALTVIESLKCQLELQREEVKTLKIKHSSKTQVFAQQSEDVYKLKEELSVLEERDNKHADVLKEAVLRAGKLLRKAHARDNQPVHLKRVTSCPDLDVPFPSGPKIEPTQKRKVKQCWGNNPPSCPSSPTKPTPPPTNVCQVYTDYGDITLCTREREKVLIMKDHEKVAVKSLRAPRDESYLHHTRPFSPTCTCEPCRRLTGGTDTSRPQSARSLTLSSDKNTDTEDSSLQIKVGDRVRCRSARPGYNESRVVEGIVEFIGKRRGYGKGLFVGVNLGVPLGDNNGCIDGERLFRCAPKHGVIVPVHNVLAYFSLKSQSFVPLILSGVQGSKKRGTVRSKRRPKSANNTLTAHNNNKNLTFSTISVDERFVRSPYLQSLIAVDPYSPDFKAGYISKPRISRPIPRQKAKTVKVYYN